jgi:hypothetical protein
LAYLHPRLALAYPGPDFVVFGGSYFAPVAEDHWKVAQGIVQEMFEA